MFYCNKEALKYFAEILKCRELKNQEQSKCIIKLTNALENKLIICKHNI